MSFSEDIKLLKKSIKQLVESTTETYGSLPEMDGYRSTALATIDAVFSANARYESVEKIIARIKTALTEIDSSDPKFAWFDLEYLLSVHKKVEATFPDDLLEDSLADQLYANRSVIGGQRKSIMVDRLARQLVLAHERIQQLPKQLNGIDTFDLIWQKDNRLDIGNKLIDDLTSLKGIGPATSRYLLLLLGGPYVKPDVMTGRFVTEILEREASADEVSFLLESAINQLIIENKWTHSVGTIDHLIWRFKSGRPLK